jgi:hypothetical protein
MDRAMIDVHDHAEWRSDRGVGAARRDLGERCAELRGQRIARGERPEERDLVPVGDRIAVDRVEEIEPEHVGADAGGRGLVLVSAGAPPPAQTTPSPRAAVARTGSAPRPPRAARRTR